VSINGKTSSVATSGSGLICTSGHLACDPPRPFGWVRSVPFIRKTVRPTLSYSPGALSLMSFMLPPSSGSTTHRLFPPSSTAPTNAEPSQAQSFTFLRA